MGHTAKIRHRRRRRSIQSGNEALRLLTRRRRENEKTETAKTRLDDYLPVPAKPVKKKNKKSHISMLGYLPVENPKARRREIRR